MIPTETSMNRCRATIHAGFERGIKTMIVRVTLAYRYAVFSSRKPNESRPMKKIASMKAARFAPK